MNNNPSWSRNSTDHTSKLEDLRIGSTNLACPTGFLSPRGSPNIVTMSFLFTASGDAGLWYCGGLVGHCGNGNIEDCYSHKNIVCDFSSPDSNIQLLGSLVGGFGNINNSYSSGNISITIDGNVSSIGGLMGSKGSSNTITNCYSVGTVTIDALVKQYIGGFLGNTGTLNLTNCAWYTGAYTKAIGHYTGGDNKNLEELSAGTDETDIISFMCDTTHVVYDQGNVNAWDFSTPIWYTNHLDYPDFVGSACPAVVEEGEKTITIIETHLLIRKNEFQSEPGDNTLVASDSPAAAGDDPLTIYEVSVETYANPEQDE